MYAPASSRMEAPTTFEDLESSDTLEKCLEDLRAQMEQIHSQSRLVRTQLKTTCKRFLEDSTVWLDEPLQPKRQIRAWIRVKGLPANPTLREFLDAVFNSAEHLNLETRTLVYSTENARALWKGTREVSVFEILETLPTLFE